MSNVFARKTGFSVDSPAPLASTDVTLKSRLTRRIIAAVLMLLTLLATPARAEWREATTEHFIIVSGGSEAELVRFGQRLEAVHWLLGQTTRADSRRNGSKVKIYLVDRLSDVHNAMGVTGTSGAAAFYRPTSEGAIAVVPRDLGRFSSIALYHEYAHHFMLQYLPRAFPPWFVEGFAEVASTASFEQDGKITWGKAADHRAEELRFGGMVPSARMFAPRSRDDEQAGVASYGQYWLTAHYFIFAPERRGQLDAFIQAINSGQTHEQAYAAFTGGIGRVDADLRRYMRAGSFLYVAPDLPHDVMRMPLVRTLRPGEAAIIADELQAARPMSAEAHLPIAGRVAAILSRYPDDPAVALLYARLLYYAGRHADAEAAFDRVLALDTENVRALTFKGLTMLEGREARDEDIDEAVLAQARGYIVRANRANPEDQVPLIAYFRSFGLAGEAPPQVAIDGLTKAVRLVPQDPSLRLMLARVHIDRGNLPQARTLLTPLALAPHRSGLQAYALQIVQWIDAGGEGDPPVPDGSGPEEEEADGDA